MQKCLSRICLSLLLVAFDGSAIATGADDETLFGGAQLADGCPLKLIPAVRSLKIHDLSRSAVGNLTSNSPLYIYGSEPDWQLVSPILEPSERAGKPGHETELFWINAATESIATRLMLYPRNDGLMQQLVNQVLGFREPRKTLPPLADVPTLGWHVAEIDGTRVNVVCDLRVVGERTVSVDAQDLSFFSKFVCLTDVERLEALSRYLELDTSLYDFRGGAEEFAVRLSLFVDAAEDLDFCEIAYLVETRDSVEKSSRTGASRSVVVTTSQTDAVSTFCQEQTRVLDQLPKLPGVLSYLHPISGEVGQTTYVVPLEHFSSAVQKRLLRGVTL